MRLVRLRSGEITAPRIAGRVLTHDVAHGLRKGTVLDARHVEALQAVAEIHLVELDEDDLHEDEAALRLGGAVVGPGTRLEGPVQSQVRLVAEHRGLLRVEREAVDSLNRLSTVGVFTLVDGQAVDSGEEVAGAKVTPVAVPGSLIRVAGRVAAAAAPVLRVEPLRPLPPLGVVPDGLKA